MLRDEIDILLNRMDSNELLRVLRLCWAIGDRGAWSDEQIRSLASAYPAPVAWGSWRKECAAALDRIAACGEDDPVGWLGRRIREYAHTVERGQHKAADGKWWLKDGEYARFAPYNPVSKDAAQASEILRRNKVEEK